MVGAPCGRMFLSWEKAKKKRRHTQCGAFWAALSGHFPEHFQPHFASGNFAQRRDGGFVARFHARRMPLREHTRTVGGRQHKLEAVGDLLQSVFNSNTCHDEKVPLIL